jgi:hypothetical protein
MKIINFSVRVDKAFKIEIIRIIRQVVGSVK